MRYEVFAGDVVIGWSELEKGDPPMGVALGVLHPGTATGAGRDRRAPRKARVMRSGWPVTWSASTNGSGTGSNPFDRQTEAERSPRCWSGG
jgi:hypothetical protein